VRNDPWLIKIRRLLLKALPLLELPPNPIDHLTNLCGGPAHVAEMTGRSQHLVQKEDGSIEYIRRCPDVSMKMINMAERESFQAGRKVNPSNVNPKPSNVNPKPSNLNPKPFNLNPKPSNLNPEP